MTDEAENGMKLFRLRRETFCIFIQLEMICGNFASSQKRPHMA